MLYSKFNEPYDYDKQTDTESELEIPVVPENEKESFLDSVINPVGRVSSDNTIIEYLTHKLPKGFVLENISYDVQMKPDSYPYLYSPSNQRIYTFNLRIRQIEPVIIDGGNAFE